MDFTPFVVRFDDDAVADLHRRLASTRWPAQPVEDWSHGMPLTAARSLAARWAATDLTATAARLDEVEQVTTTIDGQLLHLALARSDAPSPLPLLVLHGYPSSSVEYFPLLDGLRERGFDVVVPSLPGSGFSTPLRGTGWGLPAMARAFDAVMTALGHRRYGVLAADVGAGVAAELGLIAGDRLVGTLLLTDPGALGTPYSPPAEHLDEQEAQRLRALVAARSEDFGYLALQQTRPQSVAFGLADSPAMQLVWIAEKFAEWRAPGSAPFPEGLDVDLLLTIVTVAWMGGGGAGAAELLWSVAHNPASWGRRGPQPVGYAAFGEEPLQRRVLDPDRTGFWSEHPTGGHFPTLEVPELLLDDAAAFFGPLSAPDRLAAEHGRLLG